AKKLDACARSGSLRPPPPPLRGGGSGDYRCRTAPRRADAARKALHLNAPPAQRGSCRRSRLRGPLARDESASPLPKLRSAEGGAQTRSAARCAIGDWRKNTNI